MAKIRQKSPLMTKSVRCFAGSNTEGGVALGPPQDNLSNNNLEHVDICDITGGGRYGERRTTIQSGPASPHHFFD